MKQTPGPWTVEENGTSIWAGGRYIAETYDNDRANAPLIAAAPDMLEALKEARAFFEDAMGILFGPGHDIPTAASASLAIKKLDVAIAKAEGRS